jgi:hypothetical protein
MEHSPPTRIADYSVLMEKRERKRRRSQDPAKLVTWTFTGLEDDLKDVKTSATKTRGPRRFTELVSCMNRRGPLSLRRFGGG